MAKPRQLHPQTARAVAKGTLQNWPPAPKGNQRAMRHGARAAVPDKVISQKVAAIYDALASMAPVRDGDGALPTADQFAVLMLAQALGRLETCAAYIDKHGAFNRKGEVIPAVAYESALRKEVGEHLASLGMTPKARARLGVDLVRQRDLAKEWSAKRTAKRPRAIDAGAEEE